MSVTTVSQTPYHSQTRTVIGDRTSAAVHPSSLYLDEPKISLRDIIAYSLEFCRSSSER